MKFLIPLSIAMLLKMSFSGLIAETPPQQHTLEIIRVEEISQEFIDELFKGSWNDTVIEFSEGIIIPLKSMCIEGNLLEMDVENVSDIRVLKTFYVKFKNGEPLFSLDTENWKNIAAFFTGTGSVAFGESDGQPFISTHLDLNNT